MSFQGKKNAYTCQECGEVVITLDVDEGVTPFMIGCKAEDGCIGDAYSAFYRLPAQLANEQHEYVWRKPTAEEYANAIQAARDHYDNGGLLLARASDNQEVLA